MQEWARLLPSLMSLLRFVLLYSVLSCLSFRVVSVHCTLCFSFLTLHRVDWRVLTCLSYLSSGAVGIGFAGGGFPRGQCPQNFSRRPATRRAHFVGLDIILEWEGAGQVPYQKPRRQEETSGAGPGAQRPGDQAWWRRAGGEGGARCLGEGSSPSILCLLIPSVRKISANQPLLLWFSAGKKIVMNLSVYAILRQDEIFPSLYCHSPVYR